MKNKIFHFIYYSILIWMNSQRKIDLENEQILLKIVEVKKANNTNVTLAVKHSIDENILRSISVYILVKNPTGVIFARNDSLIQVIFRLTCAHIPVNVRITVHCVQKLSVQNKNLTNIPW